MLAVANRRKYGLGRITRFWSSSVSLPSVSSTRWITNITSGRPGVVFVEHQRHRVLQRPGQKAFAEFGDLQSVAQHDRIAPDQVDPADMRVEVDPDARPVEPRGHLFDMSRFASAVIALHHHAAIVGKAREDRQRGVRIEHVALIEIGHALVGLAENAGHIMSTSIPKTSRTLISVSGAASTVVPPCSELFFVISFIAGFD